MNEELNLLAQEIDNAVDLGDIELIRTLLDQCSSALGDACGHDRPLLHFYEANCYSAIAEITSLGPDQSPDWHQDSRIPEVLSLRRAITEPGFEQLDDISKCKIYTNLGNRLNQLGRLVEAIRYWDTALSLMPNFAMALGNKGFGLSSFAEILYDPNHQAIMLAHARKELGKTFQGGALWDGGYFPEIADSFKQRHADLLKYLEHIKYDFYFDFDQFSLGETEDEVSYRRWCLRNGLFLSPLNDILRASVASQDVLHLPSHTYSVGEDPRFPKYFNFLKQEYVTARFFLYEAIHSQWGPTHFSDKDVLLLDGFDGAQIGYRAEQLKTAYRMTYSIFDKISIFLNTYFDLGLKVDSLSFSRVWGQRNHGKFIIRDRFEGSKNLPLRGLYYLSKDLFDDDFKDVSLPDAQEIAKLRNRLEHRFVGLQYYPAKADSTENLTYITADSFQEKTLRLMSMAREALIYLSLAMHWEEVMQPRDDSKVVMPIYSVPIERD